MTEIVLTILTGVHAGAEIRLPPGEYALGRAEDCDLILTDSSIAPRHCALLVPEKGGMSVRPLEGELTLDGTPCSALFTLPAAKPLLAGLVCLAWAYDGQSLRDITPPSLLAAPAGGSEKTQPGAPPGAPPGTKDGPAGTDGAGDADPSPHPDSATRTAPRASSAAPVRLFRRVLPLGALALLLSGLTIQFIIPGNGPNRPGLDLAAFESALRVAGFSSLLVAGDNGRAVVSGLVANLGDANKVRAIAARQSYPVQVLVRDREEFIRALESILAGHGLFPQVRIDAEGATLLGYALDALVERAALSWARGGLPHFVTIRSGLLTRKDVEETLLAELARAGLSDTVSIDWQPGVVALAGPGADSPLLPGVIRAAREALRSPIAFQINSAAAGEQIYVGETASQEARPALLSPEAALSASLPGDPFGPSVSLRSVTPAGLADARTLPFITISDGRLYFVGGTLPSGYTLTGVYPDRLEFSKNNSPLAYKLQGR